jgi:peptidoglycan/xylan/chitin deacetylase (PgdA/CDA1 family)
MAATQYEISAPGQKSAFRWPEGKRAALSLSFDDARPTQIDKGLLLLNKHGVRATFYVSPSRLRERLEGWKRAAKDGHEIGNHSLTHPCSGNFPWSQKKALELMTLDVIREELVGATREIEAQLAVTPRTFAYPCGQTFVGRGRDLKSYVPLVAELFQAGRGWMNESPNDPVFCDLALLMGVSSDNQEFDQIRPAIEQAKERGAWLVLAGHDIGSTAERQTTRIAMLEALCKYAQDPANGIWIDTIAVISEHVARQRVGLKAEIRPR